MEPARYRSASVVRRHPAFSLPTLLVLTAFPVLLAGCSAGPKYLAADYKAPSRYAVLPFTNLTNDVSAPETVRKALYQSLAARGYNAPAMPAIDEILKTKFGITDGGQLGSASPANLGKALSADGLFYGEVVSFMDLPLGYVRKRTVKVHLKLVDAASEQPLWEDQRSWTTPEIHIKSDDAQAAAARQVAERQLEKMTGQFLQRETQIVIERLLSTLPGGR